MFCPGGDTLERKSMPLFLTGFSGTGKSTVGRALAFSLDRQFFDLDQEIEILSGSKIATLLREQGEAAFRKLESSILTSLSMTQGSVIALGGGALILNQNLQRVLNSGFVIYLESTMERIKKNLESDNLVKAVRPFVLTGSSEELATLFLERQQGYESAHMKIKMDGLSIQQACDQVQKGYVQWQNQLN